MRRAPPLRKGFVHTHTKRVGTTELITQRAAS
jgi:hypothetical protein